MEQEPWLPWRTSIMKSTPPSSLWLLLFVTAIVLPLATFLPTYDYSSYLLFFVSITKNPVLEQFFPHFKTHEFQLKEKNFYSIISTFLLLFFTRFLYHALILFFSTITTTAVAYTVAYGHVSQQVTFQKFMSLVPKDFKRLLETSLPFFLLIFFYNIVASFFAIVFILGNLTAEPSRGVFEIFVVVQMLVFAYATIIWHFLSVVTALEGVHGREAIKRSRNSMKGKVKVAMKIFLIPLLGLIGIEIGFWMLVVFGHGLLGVRLMLAVVKLLALIVLILLGFVALNALSFVRKSHYHVKVEKARLFDHLEGHFAENELLLGRDMQFEQDSDLPEIV